MYKGLTDQVGKEAFDWNDDFMRNDPVQNQNICVAIVSQLLKNA